MDVYLNGTLLNPLTNTNKYRAYIETLLCYGCEAKKSQLSSQLWYKDTADRTDVLEIADGDTRNLGFMARRAHVTQNHDVDIIGRLFMQDRFLINGVDVTCLAGYADIRHVPAKPCRVRGRTTCTRQTCPAGFRQQLLRQELSLSVRLDQ